MCFVAYVFCHCISKSYIQTDIAVDVLYGLISVGSGFRVFVAFRNGVTDQFMWAATLRTVVRVAVTLICLDVRKSSVWNLLYAAVCCYSFIVHPPSVWSRSLSILMCMHELASWLVLVIISAYLETYFATLVRTTLQAEDAWHAVEKLLSAFCDAVVLLSPEMRIRGPTPKLLHLLCPGGVDGRVALEATQFTEHLASESDAQRFAI